MKKNWNLELLSTNSLNASDIQIQKQEPSLEILPTTVRKEAGDRARPQPTRPSFLTPAAFSTQGGEPQASNRFR